ncbi:unnamed protein product [Protopolystoma xenopodis]|uniref:Calponin-homology (CH) domain-containing protein n=1 Tax=Protopolystoma xenopodis TaxID=117903 RepID=A0A448WCN4_9PLAT|nr:unnamed protein product [Protopolystoma xenopodis]
MAAHFRAEKSGFAREVQKTLKNKFDPHTAAKTITWIGALEPLVPNLPAHVLEAVGQLPKNADTIDSPDYFAYLKSGFVLGYLMACLDEARGKQLTKDKAWTVAVNPVFEATKQRERIGLFLNFARAYGVSSACLFQTDQLYESTDLAQVIICLASLGSEAQAKPDYRGPEKFWIQKHRENRRLFTEEQMSDGRKAIGLMNANLLDSTKVNIGARRHITGMH